MFLLKLGERRTHTLLSCFRRFRTWRCWPTVVHNSTVSSHIVYLCRNRYARRQLVLCRVYFQYGEDTCRLRAFFKKLEILENYQHCQHADNVLPPNNSISLLAAYEISCALCNEIALRNEALLLLLEGRDQKRQHHSKDQEEGFSNF